MGRLGPGIPSLAMEKATLKVVVGNNVPMSLKFQYNPEQFQVEKSADWTDPKASGAADGPPPTFVSVNPRTVTMDIFFDAFQSIIGDVTKDVDTLFIWTRPCEQLIDNKPQPPTLALNWGSSSVLSNFQGYLSRVSATYTMFRVDGTPVRATANITLIEVPTTQAVRQNPTSGGRAVLRSHVVIEGESLHSVAWAEYGHASYWRALADFNGIDDPTRVVPGTRLLLPQSRDAAKLA